jgi:hypothetical protein
MGLCSDATGKKLARRPSPRAASIDRGVDRSFDAYAFVLNLLD